MFSLKLTHNFMDSKQDLSIIVSKVLITEIRSHNLHTGHVILLDIRKNLKHKVVIIAFFYLIGRTKFFLTWISL